MNPIHLAFIFITLSFALPFLGMLFGHILAKKIVHYLRRRKLKKTRALMEAHADIYETAINYLMEGNRELGEMKLQEYARKTGVEFKLQTVYMSEDRTRPDIYGDSDVFHPDGYGDEY